MIILIVGLKLPLDSLALFQEIPPAHRPHWPGQSPQNPETNLFLASTKFTNVLSGTNSLSYIAKVLLCHFFSHPNVIVPVENLWRQNISLPCLFLSPISHVRSVILISNVHNFYNF